MHQTVPNGTADRRTAEEQTQAGADCLRPVIVTGSGGHVRLYLQARGGNTIVSWC